MIFGSSLAQATLFLQAANSHLFLSYYRLTCFDKRLKFLLGNEEHGHDFIMVFDLLLERKSRERDVVFLDRAGFLMDLVDRASKGVYTFDQGRHQSRTFP